MNMSLLLAYGLSVLMLVATPGPVVALIISTSLNAGPRQAWLTALGTNAAALLLALLAVLMLYGGLALDPRLIHWVSVPGCCFIAWLALRGLAQAAAQDTAQAGEQPSGSRAKGLLNGFLVGIGNPKDIIFFVSFFPQFIQVSSTFARSALALILVWVLLDLLVLGAYIQVARQGFTLKYKRLITTLSSLLLLTVALLGLGYSLLAIDART